MGALWRTAFTCLAMKLCVGRQLICFYFCFLIPVFDYVGKGTTINLHQRIFSKNNVGLMSFFLCCDHRSQYRSFFQKGNFLSYSFFSFLFAYLASLLQRFSILSHELYLSFLSCKRKKRNKERLPAASPEAKKFFQLLRRKNSCFALKQFAPLNALSSTFLHASSAKAGEFMILAPLRYASEQVRAREEKKQVFVIVAKRIVFVSSPLRGTEGGL